MKNHLYLALATLIVIQCSTNSENEKRISASNVELNEFIPHDFTFMQNATPIFSDVHYSQTHEVDGIIGDTIELIHGGKIVVPANAFVNADGQIIKEKVKLEITEFKTIADIVLSGIKMQYDSAGVNYNFKSAGMYKIQGFVGQESIYMASNKSLEVSTTSNKDNSESYSFYNMNNDGTWRYESTDIAEKFRESSKMDSLKEPEPTGSNDFVFTINADESYGLKNPLWKLDEPLTEELENVLTNANIINSSLDKSNRHQLAYDLKIKTDNGLREIKVTPMLMGEDLEKEMEKFNSNMQTFLNNKEAVADLRKGKYARTVEIKNFGLYNWDIKLKTERENFIADFSIKDYPVNKELCSVFLISPHDEITVNYHSSLSEFSADLDTKNVMIVTLPGNKVGVINEKEFNLAVASGGKEVHFEFSLLEDEITNTTDLEKIIFSL